MKRVQILLADDHTLFCALLRKFLEPQYEVVGVVSDGRTLLKAAVELKPDVAVIDIGMPLLNGLDAGRELKRSMPNLKLVYLTMNANPDLAREALQNGASAYVLKNARSSEVLQAIKEALRGATYVAPQIKRAMDLIFIRDPAAAKRPQHLTERQREVLQMFAEGRSLKEIADSLQIAYRTVRFHKFRIMEELGIKTNSELVHYAIKHDMVSCA
jgi:DNA-binding NarL/FixJ family response regulator